MKKLSTLLVLIAGCLLLQSSVKRATYNLQPPQGYTGAEGSTCVDCHNSFGLNSGGGHVTVTGLPTSDYVPGKQYDFSLTITHSAANRKRWGFSIKAVDGSDNSVGTFTSTNANAKQNGDELSHSNAVITSASSTFTYGNLHWTAPATAGQAVNFYFVGNAANNSGDPTGDYIYSNVVTVALPLVLKDFTASEVNDEVRLDWHTAQEIDGNYFTVQKSVDGQRFYDLTNVDVSGNDAPTGYSYTDATVSYYGRSIFYRLKMVDKDGKFSYSPVVSVLLKAQALQIVNVYPNVLKAGGMVTARIISDKTEMLRILLVDASGRGLQGTTQIITTGNNNVRFAVNATGKGMVYARFIAGSLSQTIPLVVN